VCREEQADPDANGADRDTGGEGADHPASVLDHLAAADCADGE
jgi:hypothetical protein